MDCPTDVRDPM